MIWAVSFWQCSGSAVTTQPSRLTASERSNLYGHPMMRGTVVVDTESNYQAWLQHQKTFAELTAPVKKAEIGRKAPL